ncbi:23S rRNA (uracil(1939)-C(5))-methyltransferase RlmD [Alkalinema sp. FACHB-956]|uniref:23S rRNA (uracil(1939)-C(5))-methyltransferase RlmD n=1 Tax=Alkalinema sp. FACHB-956 TaxID=2692768 RepID=UPI001687B8B6|nr:23S rRNA (uracil(1939)-C(5))-methyltransferase RlmD [Alkalinema sp. FACHB-956]MBD2327477.1 23S rRNA (uracil(1939)-C(5))-methyltransferase RlmD [Alkalinema sp. FACHB-956]
MSPDSPSVSDRSGSWQQGALVEVTITDLSDSGDGVGRMDDRVVFVPDTVTGDRVSVRLLRVKPQYAHGKVQELLEASPHRIRPSCIVADKCGGCQWQHVNYEYQLEAKRNQVRQALQRIGGFSEVEVDPVLTIGAAFDYRNKSTYPLGIAERQSGPVDRSAPPADPQRSIVHGRVIAGYYQKGSHQIVNLNQCPIQDQQFNPILEAVKQDIGKRKWPIYDEKTHQGNIRHLSLRVGRRTGDVLLTIVAKDRKINDLWPQASAWMQRFGLVGVCLNLNPGKTNAIFGPETFCIAGQGYLEETFADLTFQIGPDTFFQVYTEQAEALLQVVRQELNLQGQETIVDAYCGIGTLTLPLAKQAKQVIGIEVQAAAIDQAKINAANNQIDNTEFHVGAVETVLPTLEIHPEVVLLDPPRKGCDGGVLATLRQWQPNQIVYISCNPATLARDLKILCADGLYQLQRVQPADFFPQTPHVETAAFLVRSEGEST